MNAKEYEMLTQRTLTMAQAVAEAIGQEMEREPKVFVMGEDIGRYGGIFGATGGLLERFGPERIMDTPISETAFIGAALDAAAEGMRPIAELMFVDFFGVCMDQIYNHLAKNTYMSGGALRLPVVLMTAIGGGYGDAAQHSQCLYGTFAHVPGLKVVVPSNAYDAKGLMTQAIRDDNPVMVFLHKGLMGLPWMRYYEGATTAVPVEPYTLPFGRAAVLRKGRDLTIVTLGQMVHKAMLAAQTLSAQDIEAEVIDLRTLVPLDIEAIEASVRKTGRCLIVHEATRTCGFGAELSALVQERCFYHLEAPIERVTGFDTPYPHSLEWAYFPGPVRIGEAVDRLLKA